MVTGCEMISRLNNTCCSRVIGVYKAGVENPRLVLVQNHYVWETGEPAFVKWFIRQPATLLGGAALQREEGLQQHYVAGAVEAYLAECGVAMSRCRSSRAVNSLSMSVAICSMCWPWPLLSYILRAMCAFNLLYLTTALRCRLRQLPSLMDEELLTDQATIRRQRDLPLEGEYVSPKRPFELDEM